MNCNNKLHKQKEYFLFVISDSKSLQLILKFYVNGFFSYFDCKITEAHLGPIKKFNSKIRYYKFNSL